MVQRIFAALGLASCLLACTSTTSLGGPTQKASPSSVDEVAEVAEDDEDASPAGGLRCASVGYSWAPEPSTTACQFLVPPDPGSDPDYNPARWNPGRVRTEMWVKDAAASSTKYGPYVGSPEGCGDGHGWFYVPSDDPTPTLFELCPQGCAFAEGADVYFRLAYHKPCPAPHGE